ncbi:hypothetical protein HBB16_04595 [Pseudonocardia sp. MCCB 268]|nr:hypothetical protein [Pseudonocardia cytotoxica]
MQDGNLTVTSVSSRTGRTAGVRDDRCCRDGRRRAGPVRHAPLMLVDAARSR